MTLSLANSDPAAIGDIAGHAVALRYAGIESEYASLRRSAMLVDRSHRTRMTFEGDRRAETLTGLVTNDVGALTPGTGQYAAALTPRGKIIADIRVFARESELLVDVPVRAALGWVAMVRKYVNPRTTRYADRSDALADIGVFGAHSRDIVAALSGVSPDVLGALAAVRARSRPWPTARQSPSFARRTSAAKDTTSSCRAKRGPRSGDARWIRAPCRRDSTRGRSHGSRPVAPSGASTSMTPRFHRRRISMRSMRSRTRKGATRGRRRSRASISAATSIDTFAG